MAKAEYWLRVSWFANDVFMSKLRVFSSADERALGAIDELALGNTVQHAGRHELHLAPNVVIMTDNLRALLSCVVQETQDAHVATIVQNSPPESVLRAILMSVNGIGNPETLALRY